MNTTNKATSTVGNRIGIKNLILIIISIILVAGLSIVPVLDSTYITVLLITILVFVVLTVAWAMFSGPTGYISLATAAFFGIGMYTAAVLGKQVPFTLLMIVAGVISFAFALLVGSVTLRLRGIYFTIFTFGLVYLVSQLLTWWEVRFTNTRGRFVVMVDNNEIFYHMLALFVIVMVVTYLIRRSKWGLALQSIGQDEDAAVHAGVNATALKILVFALSAFFMGAAGAALATRVTYIDPGAAFNVNYSFFPVLMAIFGGLTNLWGVALGAAAFAYLEEFLTTKLPEWYMLTFGAILLIVITFFPNGLIGLIQKWRKGGIAKTDANT